MEDITKNPSKIDYIKKLMDPLKFYPLNFYEIIIDKKTILSWPFDKIQDSQNSKEHLPPIECNEIKVF